MKHVVFALLLIYSICVPIFAMISLNVPVMKLVTAIAFTFGIVISVSVISWDKMADQNDDSFFKKVVSGLLIILYVFGTVMAWWYYTSESLPITITCIAISIITCITTMIYDLLLITQYNPRFLDFVPDSYGSL